MTVIAIRIDPEGSASDSSYRCILLAKSDLSFLSWIFAKKMGSI